MTWDDFYDSFYEWSDSTKVKKVSSICTIGDEDDVVEIASEYAFIGNKECTLFLKKAISLGLTFSSTNMMELVYNVDPSFVWELAQKHNTPYTEDQLDELATYLSDDQLKVLAKKSKIHYQTVSDAQKTSKSKAPGLFGILVALSSTDGDNKKSSEHRCNGDCANCPAHYGYRHGRWYYGHNHTEGCEFGGNSGSGGKD